jgi:hypothetical protein
MLHAEFNLLKHWTESQTTKEQPVKKPVEQTYVHLEPHRISKN